jgi:cysteine synthase A
MTEAPRTGIVDSVLSLVGATPMVRLRRMTTPGTAEVVLKLESFNPAGSVKDRVALAMIEAAERDGKLRPGDTIVEPTSGNTGIGLALVAAVKGYRLIITMPDDTSPERRALLTNYGAEVVLTPARRLMKGAIERAREIVSQNPRCFMPQQFDNGANPRIHRETTAREILAACEGTLDAFVSAVGTGGTITGVGKILKQELPNVRVIGVEPASSAVLSGKKPGMHAIQGIGAGFVPAVLERELLDEVLVCEDASAFETASRLAKEEGISAGISAGAAVWGALQVGARFAAGSRVVTVLPDSYDHYASVPRPGATPSGLDFII